MAYDFGIKRNILRLFAEHDCRVTVVPAETTADEALALEPNGVFLSNGPGDPAAVSYAPRHGARNRRRRRADLRYLPGASDLGPHLRRAHGEDAVRPSRRKSSREGHRDRPRADHGAEPRIRRRREPRIEIPGAPELEVTHVNLNDGTVEGLRHREQADLRRPVPSGGGAGPARRPPAVRRVPGNGPFATPSAASDPNS